MNKKNLLLLCCSFAICSCSVKVDNSLQESSLQTESDYEQESSLSVENDSSLIEDSSIEIEDSEQLSSEKINVLNEVKTINDYLGSDNDVYRINITTEGGAFPVDKDNYVVGSLGISEQDTSKISLEDQPMKVKLRGNSTLAACKKPFKIKFESKQSLFGMTKAKEYVLLANYYDKTNIRNYLAYLTANKLTNLKYQPSYVFVDVYFNEQYQGLYLLCEQMEANAGRVDIKNNVSEDGISSFMLEADERASEDYPGYENTCYFKNNNYVIAPKYPDPDDYIDALADLTSLDEEKVYEANETINQFTKDMDWLKTYFADVSDALNKGFDYKDYIDEGSFIDYYLVEEFFKNVDVASTSQYYYIDQNDRNEDGNVLLHMGPVWDFDISSGVVDDRSNSIYANYALTQLYVKNRDPFFKALFNDSSFVKAVKTRYSEIREAFVQIFDEIDTVKVALEAAQARNVAKWELPGERVTWLEIYAMSDRCFEYSSLDDAYDALESFLTKRLSLMDKNYLIK